MTKAKASSLTRSSVYGPKPGEMLDSNTAVVICCTLGFVVFALMVQLAYSL